MTDYGPEYEINMRPVQESLLLHSCSVLKEGKPASPLPKYGLHMIPSKEDGKERREKSNLTVGKPDKDNLARRTKVHQQS